MAMGMTNADINSDAPHDYYGCRVKKTNEGYICTFRLYAPEAQSVYLSGDHNGWATDERMTEISNGVWEYTLKTDCSPHGLNYKYLTTDSEGSRFIADPFARFYEDGGEGASKICEDEPFLWEDRLWLERRRETVTGGGDEFLSHPLNIYEVHLPTWKSPNGDGGFDLCRAADELSEYVKQLGCTHIAVVYDGSQPYIRHFAPDPRLGTATELKYFVNKLHSVGVGVIFDFVPVWYDIHGKAVKKPYAKEFVISSAVFLLREFHADGLKLVSVPHTSDVPSSDITAAVHSAVPDVLTISEAGADDGTDLAYNTEWTRLTLDYVTVDPLFRKGGHGKLTEPARTAFARRHLLSFSHRDMSGGRRSLLDKNYGSYDMKFAGTRLLRAYQMTYPGKKLTFMGAEYGPFKEWCENTPLEWFMLDFERHRQLLGFTAELGNFYLSEPALWEMDFSPDGFEWIYPDMAELNVIAYKRLAKDGSELVALLNFAPVDREGFTVINMRHRRYKEVFSSDAARFGGTDRLNHGVLETLPVHDGTRSLKLTLPGLSAVILKPISHL